MGIKTNRWCIAFFCIAIFSTAFLPLHAQLKIGGKIGANWSRITEKKPSLTDLSNIIGPRFGAVAAYDIGSHWGLQGELLYNQMGFKTPVGIAEYDVSDLKNRSHYLSLPLIVKFYPQEENGFCLQLGPQVSYLIDNSTKLKDTPEVTDWPQNRLDVSITAGLGLEMNNGLFFDARYVFGLTKCLKNFDSQNRSIQISIGYLFTIKD